LLNFRKKLPSPILTTFPTHLNRHRCILTLITYMNKKNTAWVRNWTRVFKLFVLLLYYRAIQANIEFFCIISLNQIISENKPYNLRLCSDARLEICRSEFESRFRFKFFSWNLCNISKYQLTMLLSFCTRVAIESWVQFCRFLDSKTTVPVKSTYPFDVYLFVIVLEHKVPMITALDAE